jgi:Fe-Mn family superoxide dismutase
MAMLLRQLIGTLLLGLTASLSLAANFTLAPLPYPSDALEPAIDQATMELHHGKHHQAYVNGLNAALEALPEAKDLSLEQLLARISQLPVAVRNNAGGHWNHTFFWESMAPVNKVGAMSSELKQAIEKQFGSVDEFKAQFRQAGLSRFGSGWVWLLLDAQGKLVITSTPNQDNPLMDIAEVRGTPLLGNDVWEHAYYLQYNNRRADYLDAWWQVVDWSVISRRYQAATK